MFILLHHNEPVIKSIVGYSPAIVGAFLVNPTTTTTLNGVQLGISASKWLDNKVLPSVVVNFHPFFRFDTANSITTSLAKAKLLSMFASKLQLFVRLCSTADSALVYPAQVGNIENVLQYTRTEFWQFLDRRRETCVRFTIRHCQFQL
jgi:hypothetical protein